ncbi:CLUMA_CG013041, isoform A [Clunio marinus]|uniref:CLUMA_CG013041, isoform A n=1 Tax=Clunio marinus TaxID=568069 RepID=A0A1J1IHJ5_9DIPT|nr:CLUMA_CG013041, isoform A [Clunio marinus]
MIQELIDTSISDQYNFQQLVPTLKESLDAIPKQISTPKYNDKFNKLCFIPPIPSNFTSGKRKEIHKVNKTCVQLALKKSICGLTRLTDYTDISESSLTMFADSVDHFFKSLMESIVTILSNDDRETETDVDLMTFERAYFALTGESSTCFFNYFKKEIFDKHQQTVGNFTQKVSELRNIVESHQSMMNEIHQPDFYQGFFVKEEVKQEFDDYET